MNQNTAVDSDAMELHYVSDAMSDGEIQKELENLNEGEENDMDVTVIECSTASNETTLSTPKIKSVVVVPESSSSNRSAEIQHTTSFNVPKAPVVDGSKKKANRNRNGSTKRRIGKQAAEATAGSLVSMLSKVKVSSSEVEAKAETPSNTKRVRSVETTPEGAPLHPSKIVKPRDSNKVTEGQTYSLVVRRTLHLKICVALRPPAGRDLSNIKLFLQSKIEEALTEKAPYVPLFDDVVKIGRDGVYVFCADARCADWITKITADGIPSIDGKLTVLPHDTPLKLNPEKIMIRTVATIPTKLPQEKILDSLAQLNKNLNTESWNIKRIRPRGSNSIVYMRMDKRSFDAITAQHNKVHWILGPITIKQEEHRSKPKPQHTTSAPTGVAAPNSNPGVSHHKPPFSKDVDGTPKGPGLTRNGGSGPKGFKKPN